MSCLKAYLTLVLVSSCLHCSCTQSDHPILEGFRKIDLSGYSQPRPGSRRISSQELNKNPNTFKGATVALCVVMRDDRADLLEYLEYYKWLGVGKVYLYDNNSNPPLLSDEAVFNMTQTGFLEYTYFHTKYKPDQGWFSKPQGIGYNDCLKKSRGRHRWVMFFDGDEYLVLPDKDRQNLTEVISEYEEYGGIGINWVLFSGRPHVTRPKGGVLKNYIYCLPADQWENKHLKVIAQPHLVKHVGSPHWVRYFDENQHWTVDEHGERLPWPSVSPVYSISTFALYHYTTRSDEDFAHKLAREAAKGGGKDLAFRNRMWNSATATCTGAVELSKVCCPSLNKDDADDSTDNAVDPPT